MKTETKGWVVINENHPTCLNPFIVESTFSRTRKEAIQNVIKGSGESWEYWYRKFNFRCVKAIQLIQLASEK